MGRKDIANYLFEQGASIDLFAAAMLGKLEIVKAMINDNPKLKNAHGPHTISLMQHAKTGGEEAKSVVEFLESFS